MSAEFSSLEKYDENKLIELFSPYGEIIQARVIRDQSTESPRGIAFVIMGTRSQAQRAGKLHLLSFSFELPRSVECLNGHMIDQQRPLLVKFADDDKRRRQLMARYLPNIDPPISSLPSTLTSNLRDPSDVLTAQMAQLNLIANSNNLAALAGNTSTDSQQSSQDMNLLMNTLLMMPFWSNICAPSLPMPVLYPSTTPASTKPNDRLAENVATTSGASVRSKKRKQSESSCLFLDRILH